MNLFNFSRTYRNLMRIKQILQVLTRHGFGHLVYRLNLTLYIPSLHQLGLIKAIPPYFSEDSVAVRLRLAMQELGPTFVKLGQILSSRPDILPDPFIQEFRKLLDDVAPFPTEQALRIIARELHAPANAIFPRIEEKAVASGSIAQVHHAYLPDGSEVMLKVKRPDIANIIKTDIAILRLLAELAEKYIEEMRVFQPVMIIEEFSRTIQKELDFTTEAAYTEQFYNHFLHDDEVIAPKVYWEYTTADLITLQKLQGVNIGHKAALLRKNIHLPTLAQRLVACFIRQYFIWGLFHADPHPGNILVTDSGKIVLVDFGMVGHLSPELKSQLATTILALIRNDLEMIIEVYSDIGAFRGPINMRELKNDIVEVLDKYFHTPFQHLDIAKVFQDVVRLARTHQVVLPRDFILLGKSLVTIGIIARELDPEFNLAQAVVSQGSGILREKFSPSHLANQTVFQLWSIGSLLMRIPSELKDLLRRLRSGDIRVTLRHESLDKILHDLDRVSNRISFSIILASIVIGSSLLTMAKVGPSLMNIPLLGIVGYLIAACLGLWLVISILRSGRL